MLKFAIGVVLGLAVFGIVAHVSRGQQAATAEIKATKIRQDDLVSMDVLVDKAPNFYGTVRVYVGPTDSADSKATLICGLEMDKKTCHASGTLPEDGQTGKWAVEKITFESGLRPGFEQELKKNDNVYFEVIPHVDIVYPQSATITNVQ
ncbi:MAG: hypothetical protein WBL50_27740 [Candidatus Acidiferrum sp.]